MKRVSVLLTITWRSKKGFERIHLIEIFLWEVSLYAILWSSLSSAKKYDLGLNGAWNGAWDRAWDQAWDQAWNWNRPWNGALSRLSYLSNFSKLVPGNGPWNRFLEWSLGMVPGKGPWEWSLEIFPGNGPCSLALGYPNSLIYHGSQKFRLDGGDKRFSCHNRMCHTSPTGNGPQFFWHCFKFAHSVDLTQSQTRREAERLYNQLSALQFVLLQSCDLISR